MNPASPRTPCAETERVHLHAIGALAPREAIELAAHLDGCSACRGVLESLSPVIDAFAYWPTDVLRPSPSLRGRLARRIAAERGAEPVVHEDPRWVEPPWLAVAPGVSCKLLSGDPIRNRVSLLVRLAPGADYPPHRHADVEELHLLDGELWVNDRKLHPGDYNRAEPGTSDQRVWSETGCTCFLVTSAHDELR